MHILSAGQRVCVTEYRISKGADGRGKSFNDVYMSLHFKVQYIFRVANFQLRSSKNCSENSVFLRIVEVYIQ